MNDRISVYCAAERVGFYKSEQDAIEAAMDYSRETDRPVVIEYPNGRYQETWTGRSGEWNHGPIKIDRATWEQEEFLKRVKAHPYFSKDAAE